MGIFGRILWRRETETPAEGKVQEKGGTVPSRRVFVNSEMRAMQVDAFFHAVDLRSTTAARARLVFERYHSASDRWEEFSKGNSEYRHLNWVLRVRPNDRMTALQAWKRMYELRDIHGLAGMLILRDAAGQVASLVPVELTWNAVDNTYSASSEEYAKTWMKVASQDVIVVRGTATKGYPQGRSMIDFCQRTLSLAATAEDMCLDVVSKGGTFRAIIKQEETISGLQGLARLDDKEVEANTDSLAQQMSEGKDFIYDSSAASITPITQSFQDLQVDLQRNKAIEGIARFMKVPLPLMFCATNAVYKSIDDAWHTFKMLTVEPMLDEVVQEMTAKLLTEHDDQFRFRFDISGLCLDSDKGKAETAQIYVASGVKTVNEVRKEMGMGRRPTPAQGPLPDPPL